MKLVCNRKCKFKLGNEKYFSTTKTVENVCVCVECFSSEKNIFSLNEHPFGYQVKSHSMSILQHVQIYYIVHVSLCPSISPSIFLSCSLVFKPLCTLIASSIFIHSGSKTSQSNKAKTTTTNDGEKKLHSVHFVRARESIM